MFVLVNIRDRNSVFDILQKENPNCDLAKLPKEECIKVLKFIEDNCMEFDPECCDDDFKWINVEDIIREFDFEEIIQLAETFDIKDAFDKSENQLRKDIDKYLVKYGIKDMVPFINDFLYNVFIVDEENKRFFVYVI